MEIAAIGTTKTGELTPPSVETITWNGLTWVYIERPTRKEVDYLAQSYPFFHTLNLDDTLSRIQLPKIDEYDDYIFVVLHFPVFNKESRVTMASEVDFFVGKDFVVTIHCAGDLKPLSTLFKDCQIHTELRERNMGKGPGYLFYRITDSLVDYCFPILSKVIDNVEKVEDRVFTAPVPQTVQEIMIVRRDLLSLRRIVRPEIPVMQQLEQGNRPYLGEDLDVYFGDIGDHLNKIWHTLEEYKDIVESLTDTSNWLTQHRMQEIMRVLTIFMAIVMPLTFITSIYGMNIRLPLGLEERGGWAGFVALMGVMVLVTVGILAFFRRKRWL
ncbi:MAG: magnesium transporter CorA family protein [Chloroflexota bacterium]